MDFLILWLAVTMIALSLGIFAIGVAAAIFGWLVE